MPLYRIIAKDCATEISFIGSDPGSALALVDSNHFTEADVFEGDRYLFTLRHGGAMTSVWTIETIADRQT